MIHHFLVLHLVFIGMMNVYVVEYVNKNLMKIQLVLWIDMVFHIVNMIIQGKYFPFLFDLIFFLQFLLGDFIINVLRVKKISYEMI